MKLLAVRDRTGVTIGEAFMIQSHPQWKRTVELVRAGRIGDPAVRDGRLRLLQGRSDEIRYIREYGGGGLMDIGCYPIKASRMVFGEEPVRVSATMVRRSATGVDTLTSAILEYPPAHCIFSCGTLGGRQSEHAVFRDRRAASSSRFRTTRARAAPRVFASTMAATLRRRPRQSRSSRRATSTRCRATHFSRAIREGTPPPVPLEDSVKNMGVIDAVFRAAESGRWESRHGGMMRASEAVWPKVSFADVRIAES